MKPTIILALICLSTMQTAYGQNRIYKCVEKGKTLYSESQCKENAYNENLFIARDEKMGSVSPDRETIEATRARIREDISTPPSTQQTTRNGSSTTTTTTTVTQPPAPAFDKRMICEATENEIKAIETQARQANSAYTQDALKEQKTKAQQRQSQYKC